MTKPSLMPCQCEDGTCKECLAIIELNKMIKKTCVITRDKNGNITGIMSTRTAMDFRRIMKDRK